MARTELTVSGFKELQTKLDPKKFERRLIREVGKATKKNGLLAERAVKEDIRKRKVTPSKLSGFTIALKGSTKALVDTGELRKSITSDVKRWNVVIIGVLKNKSIKDQITGAVKSSLMIAKILHGGATIPVTDKMRRFFLWLANSEESPVVGRVLPLAASTRVIRIPARPFLKGIMTTARIKRYKEVWSAAVGRALHGKSRR